MVHKVQVVEVPRFATVLFVATAWVSVGLCDTEASRLSSEVIRCIRGLRPRYSRILSPFDGDRRASSPHAMPSGIILPY